MNWRHFKRIIYWPDSKYHKNSILFERRTRLEFYECKENLKEFCKLTKLDEWCYETINSYPLICHSFTYIKIKFPVTGILLETDNDVDMHQKLELFTKFVNVWYSRFNDDSFSDLWILFKNAPFWKDYTVWKKLKDIDLEFK